MTTGWGCFSNFT